MAQPQLLSDADVWGGPASNAAPPAQQPPVATGPQDGSGVSVTVLGPADPADLTAAKAPLSDADVWGPTIPTIGGPQAGMPTDKYLPGDALGAPMSAGAAAYAQAHPPEMRAYTPLDRISDIVGAPLRAVGDAFSLGFANKADAAMNALVNREHSAVPFGDRYSAALDREEGVSATGAREHPYTTALGTGAGFLAQAPLLPETAAATTGGAILKNAIVGGGLSGAYALGHARGPLGSELTQAATAIPAGLALGGALGGAAGADAALANAPRIGKPNVFSPIIDPFAARFVPGAAEAQAGRVVANAATDLPTVQASLANGPQEIVPGSVPTTFQQTGDLGLGSLERGVATRNPAPFRARAGEQNAARVDTLTGVQAGADPNDVATFLKGQFDALDADTAKAVDAARTQAQGQAGAIGGTGTPEGYGADVRGAVTAAEDAARQREGALWQAIDPNGDLTGNTVQTATAARDIAAGVPKTAKPMAGEEAAIFDTASKLPPLSPVSDLIALRSRLSTEMRNELIANGRSPTYARLSQLRGSIQDNLATTISHQISNDDAAVARGVMAPSDSASARLSSFVDERTGQQVEARAVGGGGPLQTPGAGAPGNAGADGTALQAAGGLGGNAGDTSLQGNAVPTFDPAAKTRLDAATEATKTRARTFGLQPVSPITAKAGPSDIFRLPDGSVPGKFFHPGPTGFNHMQALQAAAPDAMPIIEDYAASSLRRAAMREDGTLDPAKFQRWRAAHQDAIRALPPETQARFADAATASQAVDEAATSRAAALKIAQQGAIGKVMNLTDPEAVTRTVGSILGGRTAVSDMRTLATSVAGNQLAKAGLRQAVADHIATRLMSNTEAAASGGAMIKADQFQTFMRTNRGAVAQVFTPEEINNLQAIAADIQRSNRSMTAVKLPGGSNTAQDTIAASQGGHGVGKTVARSLFDIMGAAIGGHLGGGEGAMIGTVGAEVIQSLRASGVARVDDLVTQAMLNPEVARRLLQRVAPNANPAVVTARARGLVRAIQAGTPAVAQPAPPKPPLLSERAQ